MASAHLTGRSWVASFRALNSPKARHLRIPVDQVPAVDNQKNREAAKAYSMECDRYCRKLEKNRDGHDIAHALRLGAITEEQAAQLRTGLPAVPEDPNKPPTILAAAQLHPASRNEPLQEKLRHERDLKVFLAWANIEQLSSLRLHHFTEYIDHMKAQDFADATRRHALMWLKRAAAIAPQYGLINPIAGLKNLDRHVDQPEEGGGPEAWTPEELVRAAIALDPANLDGDYRPRVGLLLGGFLSLRPTECIRGQVGDVLLESGLLKVGVRKRKNKASRRTLPLPSIAIEWLRPAVEGRAPDEPLIPSRPGNKVLRPYTLSSYARWLGPMLHEATGKDLTPKSTRKTWTKLAVNGDVPADLMEAYMGHATKLVGQVTADHYLAHLLVEELRPVAALLDTHIRGIMANLSTQNIHTGRKSLQFND